MNTAVASKLDALFERFAARLEERLGESGSRARLLDVDAAAAFLSIRPRTVYKKAARGELPFVKVGGALRFRVDELEQYVEARSLSPGRIAAEADLARRATPIDMNRSVWYKALPNGQDGKAYNGPEAKEPRHPPHRGGRRRARTTGSEDRLDPRRSHPASHPNRSATGSTSAEAPEEVVRSPEEAA